MNWRLLFILTKEAKLLWWSLGLIFLVPFLISRTPLEKKDVILGSGMVLEVAGIIVAARGLEKLRWQFGKPSLTSDVGRWLSRVAAAFKPPKVVTATVSPPSLGGFATFGEARVVSTPGPNASNEERIIALEKNLAALREEMDRKIPELRIQINAISERVGSESRERQVGHQNISRRLEDFAVGDLHIEFMGLLWVSIGLIETNVPDFIAERVLWWII